METEIRVYQDQEADKETTQMSVQAALEQAKEKNTANTPEKMQIQKLSVFYGKFQALRDIDLLIHEKQITAIIGPSGSGKSTLLRALNRMNDLTPHTRMQGEVLLDGENIFRPAVDVVDIRRRVGMVFQRPNPFPKSIYDNVAYGPRLYGIHRRSDLDRLVEQSLKQAALWD